MKKEDCKDDIKLITFYRKSIEEVREKLPFVAMSTDYFDIITTCDFNPKMEFVDITTASHDWIKNIDIVAMHSYPVYCPSKEIKEYKKYKFYKNPFDEAISDNMPFLSIIQVHITPEVMARIDDELKQSLDIIEFFVKDIHDIIIEFANNINSNNDTIFNYRIYRSLSVGDFIIAIRSNKAETSFEISSLLRMRTAVNKVDSSDAIQLVIYKTYTVLSLYHTVIKTAKNNVIYNESASHGMSNDSYFSLRCCFSNIYWSNKKQEDCKFQSIANEISENIFRLNGRYDISVSLTSVEFMRLAPLIAKFKGFIESDTSIIEQEIDKWNPKKDGFDKVMYLGYMLRNQFFSHVNERYLIHFDELSIKHIRNTNSRIYIDTMKKGEKYISQINDELYQILYKQFVQTYINIKRINGYRKNTLYYMSLMEKLIHFCKTINGLSDTRIYSYILMKQLGYVFNGLDSYIGILNNYNPDSDYSNNSILDNIEEYLRQSVHALDSYASYIRNNNLQSLQTPNYNLEGDFSVEKYLIAYSEWLSKIIDQYNKFANKYEIGALQQKLAPVFEPDSLHNAISINVLSRMRDEDESGKNLFRIMLVRCSTFKEIVNTPEIVTALFHETAHQFRYETRKKRNDALVKSCTSLWFDIVTKKLIEKIRTEIKWASCEDIFFNKIHISLVDAYLEHVYRQKDDLLKYGYDNKSFYGFKRDFIDEINSIYNKLDFIDELSEILESIKEKIKFNIDITNKTSRKKIKFLFGLEKELEKELEKPSDNLSKQFIHLMKIARKNLKELVPDEDDVIKRLDGYILHARDIYNLSSSFNANMKKVWERAYDILTDTSDNKDVKDDSDYSKTHNYFCQNPMGRYLGLDYRHKDNKEEFIKQMSDAFRAVHDKAITEIEQYLTNYREITADMFMCRILELDIFGYYNFIIRNIPISNEISKNIITRLIYVMKMQIMKVAA